MNLLAEERRRSICRQQEPRGAILFLRRVVEDRQVQHRHALHREDRLAQHRVVIDVEDDRVGMQVPSRRRLDARGEAAVRDPVLLRSDFLDGLAEKIDIGRLVARRRRDDARPRRWLRRLQIGDAAGVIERAEPRLDVEVRAIGRDTIAALRDDDVACGECAVLVEEYFGRLRERSI